MVSVLSLRLSRFTKLVSVAVLALILSLLALNLIPTEAQAAGNDYQANSSRDGGRYHNDGYVNVRKIDYNKDKHEAKVYWDRDKNYNYKYYEVSWSDSKGHKYFYKVDGRYNDYSWGGFDHGKYKFSVRGYYYDHKSKHYKYSDWSEKDYDC